MSDAADNVAGAPNAALSSTNSLCHTATHHRHSGHCPARGHKKKKHKKAHHPGHLKFKLPTHIQDQPF